MRTQLADLLDRGRIRHSTAGHAAPKAVPQIPVDLGVIDSLSLRAWHCRPVVMVRLSQ